LLPICHKEAGNLNSLLVCGGAANVGLIGYLAATRTLTEFGEDVGIYSLPAIANKIPRQMAMVKRIPLIIVIDGCHNRRVSKILDRLGIRYDTYVNLEDLGIKKLGPFTTLKHSQEDLEKVYLVLTSRIKNLLNKHGETP